MKTGSPIRFFLIVPGCILALSLVYLGVRILPANLLGWFLIVFGSLYIAGGAVFLFPRNAPLMGRSGRAAREEMDDRSFWMILPGFLGVFFAAPLEYLYLGGAERASLPAQVAGLALIFLGLALRIWTRLALKEQYTGHVQVPAGGCLQTRGPYRFIRHPGYAGYLLLCAGLVVGCGSYLSGAAVFFLLLPGLFYRMCVEEELLTAQYGDQYLEYAVRTKRLIPGVW